MTIAQPSCSPRRAVLVTRPAPEAAATAAGIAAMGLEPVLAPLLAIEQLPATLPLPSEVAAILVTSGNAIGAILPAWHQCPLLAVGEATARRAQAAGFACVLSADGDATALAELAARRLRPDAGALLLAVGAGQGEQLEAELRARGFAAIIRREIYAARPAAALPPAAQAAFDADALRACLFFSAETARVFVRLASEAIPPGRFAGVDALAIGQPAAVALERLPWRRVRVAARPTQDEMFALLR